MQNDRIGIFGGTFNPLHMGHINLIVSAHERVGLQKIFVVPAARNPKKPPVEGPTDQQRIGMLKAGLAEYSEFVEIDEQELKRGGPSYTIDTVREYAKEHSPDNLFLLVGMDQFEEFEQWKGFASILELTNLVVATRPRHPVPGQLEDFSPGIRDLVADFDRSFIQLKSGRHIEFLRLEDMEISSGEIRKRMRTGRNVDRELSIPVEEYIREQGLYAPIGLKIGDYRGFTEFCADVMFARKGINVRGFDLRKMDAAAEFTVVASGTSTRHASSLAENILRAVKEEFNVLPQSVEGLQEGRWILLDYGAVIVHVFYDYVRQEYRLEELWKHGQDLGLKDKTVQ